MGNEARKVARARKGKPNPYPAGLSSFKGCTNWLAGKLSQPWGTVPFQHEGKLQHVGTFAKEAAWEQDLKRLELGYEDEGYFNFRLHRMWQQQLRRLCRWLEMCTSTQC
jgi:hypothetical protein